jgi:hypothetical protein
MSYKTDKLVELFPEAYAADDPSSLLHKLLDTFGAELMVADENVKQLLKSHWVDYANGGALDGLGAIFGVSRRLLRSGQLEDDEAFRRRLKSIVPLFTGGGTRRAVLGAVRSALGLPFDLDQLNLIPKFEEAFEKKILADAYRTRPAFLVARLNPKLQQELNAELDRRRQEQLRKIRSELEALIELEEFAPTGVRRKTRPSDVQFLDTATEVQIELLDGTADVAEVRPTFRWTFDFSATYLLRVIRVDGEGKTSGFRSLRALRFEAGDRLDLTADENGLLIASVGTRDMTYEFVDLVDETKPARLPDVPQGYSLWRFRNGASYWDTALFDSDTFDPAGAFTVEMMWLRYNPLTFTVTMPYFLREAVEQVRRSNYYAGDLFAYEGLSIEQIPDVVDQTKAAGVRAIVQFVLNFYENHNITERSYRVGTYRLTEQMDARENFLVGNVNRMGETQAMNDLLSFGGVFDVSAFDTNYVFRD